MAQGHDRQGGQHPCHARHCPELPRVPAEELVSTEAREGDCHAGIPHGTAHDEGVEPVDAWPIERVEPLMPEPFDRTVGDDGFGVGGAEERCRFGGVPQLVHDPLAFEAHGVSADVGHLVAGKRREYGAVDTTRKEEPDRHVRHQLVPHRGGELEPDGFHNVGLGVRRDRAWKTPIPSPPDRHCRIDNVGVQPSVRSGRKRFDVTMDRQRILRSPVGEKGGDAGRGEVVRTRGPRRAPHGPRWRTQRLPAPADVQRLDPEVVACQQHPAGARVIEGQRKHPVDLVERLLPPCGERRQKHLGIAAAAEGPARGGEPVAECAEVVNLAIEDEHVACGGIHDRLMAGGRAVEDRQPPEAEPRPHALTIVADRQLLVALVVRSAMHHRASSPAPRVPAAS